MATLEEFKKFLMRDNVVDLAVAVIIGAAFGAVVNALVTDILTPVTAMIVGKPSFGGLSFSINDAEFLYGDFLNQVITFVSVAAAVFFFVVKPVQVMQARRAKGEAPTDPTTKLCGECLSEIPVAAKRCAHCAQPVA